MIMQNNIIDIIKRPNFLELKFIAILLLAFMAIQLFIVFNFDPYPESQTIISWYYSQVGILETLGMRVGEDNTIKGTYSFIYLLPSYIFFIFFKFLLFSDFIALSLANFIIINSQFFFLILVSRKLSLNIMVTSLIYILFFLTTYMWSGLIRIFPHDMLIILALLQLLFPKLKYILMVLMVYLDPIIGSLFIFFYFVLENWSSFKMAINNFFTHFFKIFFIVLIGFSLWIIPILYLENIVGYEVSRGSILYRIIGDEDEYFFSRIQVFTPFHYYLPNAISSIFPSIYFALAFGASNLISPMSSYLIYKYSVQENDIFKTNNPLFLYGICFILSYLIFVLIFGQAAASHRFDYDQYFQFGLILCLVNVISMNTAITNSPIFKVIMAYSFTLIVPIFLILIVL
jgi:hypothetical protein